MPKSYLCKFLGGKLSINNWIVLHAAILGGGDILTDTRLPDGNRVIQVFLSAFVILSFLTRRLRYSTEAR